MLNGLFTYQIPQIGIMKAIGALAATERRVPGGILIADAVAYDALSRVVLGSLYRSVAADEVGCGPAHLSIPTSSPARRRRDRYRPPSGHDRARSSQRRLRQRQRRPHRASDGLAEQSSRCLVAPSPNGAQPAETGGSVDLPTGRRRHGATRPMKRPRPTSEGAPCPLRRAIVAGALTPTAERRAPAPYERPRLVTQRASA